MFQTNVRFTLCFADLNIKDETNILRGSKNEY